MSASFSVTQFEKAYQKNLAMSEPIEYEGALLHPIMYGDIFQFNNYIQALIYDPLDYPMDEYAVLPRLYFLTESLSHSNDMQWVQQNVVMVLFTRDLCELCNMVFKGQEVKFISDKGLWKLSVDGHIFNSKQFEDIRLIILEQNGYECDDTFIHNDIKEYIKNEEQKSSEPKATMEDYQEAVMLDLKITDDSQFKRMTIRRFNRILQKVLTRENYVMTKTASMSGFVTFKGEIPHWLSRTRSNALLDKYFTKK